MKCKFYLWQLVFLFLAIIVKAQQPEGIQFFQGTWEEAKAKAKAENKLIFLDCYTVWCGPCKVLAKDVFTKKEVGEYYNTHFVNVTMDLERGIGVELQKRYNVSRFPTMLYLQAGGYELENAYGLLSAEELIEKAKDAGKLKDSVTMEQLYDEGGYKDTAFLRRFFKYAIYKTNYAPQEALNKVIQWHGYEVLYKLPYWEALGAVFTGETTGLYFTQHWQQFAKVFGEEAVLNKIADMYFNIRRLNMYKEEYRKDTAVYIKFKQRMKERQLPELAFFNAMADFYVTCRKGNYQQALAIGSAALVNGKGWQYHQMARLANWMLIADDENRAKAAVWASKAVALTKDASTKAECVAVLNDLLHDAGPSVIPSPKIYGVNL